MTALPGPFTITPRGLRDRKGGKKATRIQQGNLGSTNNSSKDVQDPPRIFGELEDSLVCVLPHNPVRQERQINYCSYFGQCLKRGAAFLEGLERIKGSVWSWEQCACSWGRGTASPAYPGSGDNEGRSPGWLAGQVPCPEQLWRQSLPRHSHWKTWKIRK